MVVLALKRNTLLGYLCVISGAILWGAIPIFSRQLYAVGYTPGMVSSMRSFIAALLSLLALIACGKIKKVRVKDIPFFIVYGVFAIGLTFFLYATSTKMLPTAMAAILLYTGPAFVNIIDRIFYKDPITRVKLVALLCTFGGCALVVRAYDLGNFRSNLIGIAVGLLSGLCYSMTTVLSRRAQSSYSGGTNAWLIMTFGALPFLFVQPPWTVTIKAAGQVEMIVLLAVISTFIPYTLYLHGLGYGIDKGFASIVATLEPVTATVMGALTFGDRLEAVQITGIIIVMAGMTLPIFLGKISPAVSIHKNKAPYSQPDIGTFLKARLRLLENCGEHAERRDEARRSG